MAHPVHVTMRSAFRPLRNSFVFPTLAMAMGEASVRTHGGFRIVHFSVQTDHLHLIVEASDKTALSSGMRGLAIRIARRLNRLVGRKGRVWADRWHGRDLTSPRAVRAALGYVLGNFRKHHPNAHAAVDPFSSAPHFTGFRELEGLAPIEIDPRLARRWSFERPPTERARTWLLRAGWLRRGRLSLFEGPRDMLSK